MKREDFEHAIRAAGAVLAVDELLVIGSQALHASTQGELPEEAARSVEVDVAVRGDLSETAHTATADACRRPGRLYEDTDLLLGCDLSSETPVPATANASSARTGMPRVGREGLHDADIREVAGARAPRAPLAARAAPRLRWPCATSP